jgi:hypothetical protein
MKIDFAADETQSAVLKGLDDHLVEIESIDGTLTSGYVTAGDDGLTLRDHFRKYAEGTKIAFDDIERIEVL